MPTTTIERSSKLKLFFCLESEEIERLIQRAEATPALPQALSSIHLLETALTPHRSEPEPLSEAVPLFFIMRRRNGEWDTGTDVAQVLQGTREDAEACAREWQTKFPLQTFGVASLVSEIRKIADPLETVKLQ